MTKEEKALLKAVEDKGTFLASYSIDNEGKTTFFQFGAKVYEVTKQSDGKVSSFIVIESFPIQNQRISQQANKSIHSRRQR